MKYLSKKLVGTASSVEKSRPSTLDSVTSVGSGGKYANVKTYDGAELREVRIVLPFGISSSALDNMRVQIVVNDENGNASIVGVCDTDRPPVGNGDTIIYDTDGDQIKLTRSGGIEIISQKQVKLNGKRVAVAGDSVDIMVNGVSYVGEIR